MHEHALIVRIRALLAQEARLDVAVLETLAKVFDEQLWQRMGYSSSHRFCTDYLGMSEDSAWRRRQCADLLQRYPALVRPLIIARKLTQTNLATIHKLVNDANAERLITEIVGKTKREVEAIVAREAPKPDVSSGIRTVQAPLTLTASELCASNEAPTPVTREASLPPSTSKPLEHRSPDRHLMRVMLSEATRETLEQIKDIAPELSLEAIVERAFATLHDELERKRRAKLKRPKRPKTSSAKATVDTVPPHQCGERAADCDGVGSLQRGDQAVDEASHATREPLLSEFPDSTGPKTHSRYIDAETRRFVLRRDRYECQFVGESGHRCCAKRGIQFHHMDAFAKGGPTVAENLTLYCKAHNLYQGELEFGGRRRAA